MRLLLKIILVISLATLPGCFFGGGDSSQSGGELPKAEPGNAPIGAVSNDEQPVGGSYNVQSESRPVVEYSGTSN